MRQPSYDPLRPEWIDRQQSSPALIRLQTTMASHNQQEPFLHSNCSSEEGLELPDLHARLEDRTPDLHYTHPKHPPSQGGSPPWLIALALAITVIGFVANTESTEYFESELGWKKPFATMYITHSSLMLPWIGWITYDRFRNRRTPLYVWLRDSKDQLCATIETVDAYVADSGLAFKGARGAPLLYLLVAMAALTVVLTLSGTSWFIALAWTTPADLTAIYNSSTFFAAAFSVPLLKEKLGMYSITAVGLSIIGTFVIAYGDTTAMHDPGEKVGTSRLFGNLVAAVGALAFGLYEVLFKKWACSSKPIRPSQSLPLTVSASALTGFNTFITLWAMLVVFHFFGIETFAWPSGKVWLWIIVAVLSGSSMMLFTILLLLSFAYAFHSLYHHARCPRCLDRSGVWLFRECTLCLLRRFLGLAVLRSDAFTRHVSRWCFGRCRFQLAHLGHFHRWTSLSLHVAGLFVPAPTLERQLRSAASIELAEWTRCCPGGTSDGQYEPLGAHARHETVNVGAASYRHCFVATNTAMLSTLHLCYKSQTTRGRVCEETATYRGYAGITSRESAFVRMNIPRTVVE